MKFRFPGRIDLTEFTKELEPLVQMLHENGIAFVSEVQISLRGYNDKDEFYARAPNGPPITVTYSRQTFPATAAASVANRVPLECFEITNTPASDRPRGLSALFERD